MKLWRGLAATLACAVVLTGCGGGDDSPRSSETPEAQPMALAPIAMATGERIEARDTRMTNAEAKRAQAATSRLPDDARVARVVLDPLAEAEARTERTPGQPLRLGIGRALAATAQAPQLAALLDWRTLDDGARVAALAFVAPGAQGLRLGVLVRALPEGARLRFYGERGAPVFELGAEQLAALHALNLRGGLAGDTARLVWGPATDGAVGTLEIELPAGVAPERLQLAVPELSQLTQTVAQALAGEAQGVPVKAGSCEVDASCTAYDAEARSVARMLFTKGGSSYLCTGTLLNDAGGSGTPYFLTASHCVADQAAASTVETYWFYRAASCGTSNPDPASTRLAGGASLLQVDAATDTTLLQLHDAAPAGAVFAGSYFGAGVAIGSDVLGLHHPNGGLLKASVGSVQGYANCPTATGNCTLTNDPFRGAMLRLAWRRGSTEAGSSGSAIFAQAEDGGRYVVGVLHGGNASCANPDGNDFYGRFDRAFDAGLRSWLAP